MNNKETIVLEFIGIYAQFIGKSKILFRKYSKFSYKKT